MIEDFKTTILNIGKKAANLKNVAAFLQGKDKIIVPDGIALSTDCFEEVRKHAIESVKDTLKNIGYQSTLC